LTLWWTVRKTVWSHAHEPSDYRKFHDAIKQQRALVTQVILLRHGVLLA
jgi:hypothetical protein